MKTKVLTALLVLVALLVLLVFLILPAPESPQPEKVAASPASSGAVVPRPPGDSASPVSATDRGPAVFSQPNDPPSPSRTGWEDRLDELLTSNADSAATVRGLVSSMRGLPPEAQEEYAAHAVNLCEDNQYGIFNDVFFDPATPASVKETIFNDVLNRPDEVKLPLLARTLQNSAHPMAGEAREILEMYLDLEPGSMPPVGWDQAVRSYLAEQTVP